MFRHHNGSITKNMLTLKDELDELQSELHGLKRSVRHSGSRDMETHVKQLAEKARDLETRTERMLRLASRNLELAAKKPIDEARHFLAKRSIAVLASVMICGAILGRLFLHKR